MDKCGLYTSNLLHPIFSYVLRYLFIYVCFIGFLFIRVFNPYLHLSLISLSTSLLYWYALRNLSYYLCSSKLCVIRVLTCIAYPLDS